jgi:hypothetical protein
VTARLPFEGRMKHQLHRARIWFQLADPRLQRMSICLMFFVVAVFLWGILILSAKW